MWSSIRLSDKSSPPLRIELKPSRWLGLAIAVLVPLAMVSVLRSGLPAFALVLVPPLGWSAWSAVRRRGGVSLLFRADGSAARLLEHDEEIAIEPRVLIERGPLAVLVLAEAAKVRRFPCAPDTLDASARRDLRLWFARHIKPARVKTASPQHEAAHV